MKIVKVDIFRIVPLCIKTKSEFSTSFPYRCGKYSDEGCGTISACCETFAEFRNALRSSVSVPQKFHMFLRSSAYVMRSSACVMRRLEVRVVLLRAWRVQENLENAEVQRDCAVLIHQKEQTCSFSSFWLGILK